VKTWSDKGWD